MERAVNVAQYRVQQPAVALSSTEHLETSFGIKQRLAVSFLSVCNKQINHLPEDEEIGRLPSRPHRVFVADGVYRAARNDSPLCWRIW